jgi:long-chain acyl-CoA synthetase
MDFTRLFDIPVFQAARYPQQQALSGVRDGNWFSMTSQEVCEAIVALSEGLYTIGLRPGNQVAILGSHGTPYWNICDLALMRIGVVPVPLHATSSEANLRTILQESEICGCWVSDPIMADLLERTGVEIKHVFCFPNANWSTQQADSVHHWDELMAAGAQKTDIKAICNQIAESIKPEQLATLLFTSGSSGEPKGVMLSHANLVSNIKSTLAIIPLGPEDKAVSFLPLSHVFERMVCFTYLAAGASVWYADQLDNLPRIFRMVRPQFFTAVPRVVERMYARIQERRDKTYPVFQPVFDWAIKLGMHYPSRGGLKFDIWKRLQFFIADVLVFHHIRRSLGGKVRGIIVGAAALDQSLARLFTSAGMPIREGYGLTETSPVLSFNRFEPGGTRFGTVGMAVPGVEIRISNPNSEGDGEIEARGPNIMMGYYNRLEETTEKITPDGWLRTGDQGRWVDRHFLKITGRLSELFKTASGKFISPQKLEIALYSSGFIEQAMVLGLNRPYVGALIVPDFKALELWAQQNKVHWTSPQYMVHNPKIEKLIRKEIDQVNQNMESAERIRAYTLLHELWTPENGLLTPTLKLRRHTILEAHVETVDQMYLKPKGGGEEELVG